MKKSTLPIIIACILLHSTISAQEDYAFRVLANKGANQLKSGDNWQLLKTGAQLKLGDELKISENASVGLVSKNGKPLELKEASVYKVSDLLAKVGTEMSVLNKYTDFILSSNSDEAKRNRLTATGAVHRGLDDIQVLLPESKLADVFNNTIIIHWSSPKPVAPVIVMIKNRFDEELMKIETSDNSVSVDLSATKLSKEAALMVEVKSKADGKSKSEPYLVKRLIPGRQESVKAELSKIAMDVKDETAFNKYLLAGFYENNSLLIDAITCYEEAIKLDPENPTYKESYEEFLLRNKIKSDK